MGLPGVARSCPELPGVAWNLSMQRGFLSDLGAKPVKSMIFDDF
jgi:hypothetical protein